MSSNNFWCSFIVSANADVDSIAKGETIARTLKCNVRILRNRHEDEASVSSIIWGIRDIIIQVINTK
jgi:hypothetical protein